MTGADAGLENIQIAKLHMLDDPGLAPLNSKLKYLHTTAERLAESQPESFDVVCALEIIEHVADRKLFLQACSQLVKVKKNEVKPFFSKLCLDCVV